MATVFYAAFDSDGTTPIGLYRMMTDDEAQTLDLERLTQDGTWQNDPTVIDELHEPEVVMVSPQDAQQIEQSLLANANAGSDTTHPDVATAVATPEPPKPPA